MDLIRSVIDIDIVLQEMFGHELDVIDSIAGLKNMKPKLNINSDTHFARFRPVFKVSLQKVEWPIFLCMSHKSGRFTKGFTKNCEYGPNSYHSAFIIIGASGCVQSSL